MNNYFLLLLHYQHIRESANHTRGWYKITCFNNYQSLIDCSHIILPLLLRVFKKVQELSNNRIQLSLTVAGREHVVIAVSLTTKIDLHLTERRPRFAVFHWELHTLLEYVRLLGSAKYMQ